MVEAFFQSTVLLVVLLNPFMLTVYLQELVRERSTGELWRILRRAALIASVVFVGFAYGGDRIFAGFLQVRFASFLVFGGVLFLVIAVRYVIVGVETMSMLRGAPGQIAGAIAMPFMIGPATVSASMLTGARLPMWLAAVSIVTAVLLTTLAVVVFKVVHDRVKQRNEGLVERYTDIVGRISALIIGTVAVDMIFRGIRDWLGLEG